MSEEASVRPFLRWVGGKHYLVPRLRSLLPGNAGDLTYYEPFVGAASLFLSLQPKRAFLSDANRHLIDCLRAVREQPDRVYRHLRNHVARSSKAYFYAVREVYNSSSPSAAQAARFIYLNKSCFNGIFRVNKAGAFNVPYGFKEPPSLPSLQHLSRASVALRHATLSSAPFQRVLPRIGKGSFVYLDPPYPPLNGTSYFTHYTADRFGESDQRDLAAAVHTLDARGVRFMMSNADTPLIRSLYAGFRLTPVSVRRFVTCRAVRHVVGEVVITNY